MDRKNDEVPGTRGDDRREVKTMSNDFILVLDFGGPQAQSMARKLRGMSFYSEVQSCALGAESVSRKAPKGLILAGGPSDRPFDEAILKLGIPVLALGAAARRMARQLDAECEGVLLTDRAAQISFHPCPLFDGLSDSDRYFERIDALKLPEGLEPVAVTADGLTPAFADAAKGLYGLQFYPESNDPDGARILSNFAENVCGCAAVWSPERFIDGEIAALRERIGDGRAVMAVSGGVDSTVCAMLMHRAIGDRLKCVFIDTGLLRKGETETVAHAFRESLGLEPLVVDASESVLAALRGVTDPREKRRVVHDQFVRVLTEIAMAEPKAGFLVEGTIYSDLLNATEGEVPAFSELTRIEPIRILFKDEVRFVGEALGISKEQLSRQPFPSAGLAVRCIGEVTEEKLALLREADAIFRAEIVEAGLDRRLTQYFAILTDTRTVGRRNGRTDYEYACALRAVQIPHGSVMSIAKLPYDLLDRVVQRIISRVPGINHVLYDVTGSPSALTEWE